MITLVIDSNFLGYRIHYGIGREFSYKDIPTGIIYGFLSTVLHLSQVFKTNDFVFCWDSKQSYRRNRYPEYKANRSKRTRREKRKLSLAQKQFNVLRRHVLPRIGFRNVFVQAGCEGDDLMAKIVMDKIGEFVIVTSDEDMFQCLKSNVKMYNPTKHKMMTHARFLEEYGITPHYWSVVKRNAGCSTDNVAGIPGVGAKTMIKFIKGELDTESKKYKEIMSKKSRKIAKRNTPLVELPYPKTREVTMRPDDFSNKGLKAVCKKYGLYSFLEKGKPNEAWRNLFNANFPAIRQRTRRRKK